MGLSQENVSALFARTLWGSDEKVPTCIFSIVISLRTTLLCCVCTCRSVSVLPCEDREDREDGDVSIW